MLLYLGLSLIGVAILGWLCEHAPECPYPDPEDPEPLKGDSRVPAHPPRGRAAGPHANASSSVDPAVRAARD